MTLVCKNTCKNDMYEYKKHVRNIADTDYKKCSKCQSIFSCFNPVSNECESCLSFGINQCIIPKNPKDNLCE